LFDILMIDLIWSAMDSLRAVVLSPLYRHFSDGPHYKVILGVGSSYSQVALATAYFAIFVAMSGRTPGMARASTRLNVRDNVTGTTPSTIQSVVRASVYLIYSLLFLTILSGTGAEYASIRFLAFLFLMSLDFIIVPLADPKKRTLHDLAAGTVVVQLPIEDPSWASKDPTPRRTFVKAVVALSTLLLIVSATVSWHHRQPDPRSALGVATFLARESPSVAASDGHRVITALDVQNANHDLTVGPGIDLAFDVGIRNVHLVVVNVGNTHACIFVSRKPGADPRAGYCPSNVPFN
jgi:uncharacterized RDD family membrane protein YckC